MKNMFFIDAETDGLYGSFLTVGIIVTDSRCNEMERYYFGLPKEKMSVTDPWVMEHVIPILGEYEECQSEHEMLEKVWAVWMKHKDTAYAIADVPFPVESRLFWQCVQVDEKSRKYDGPFPLLDLSSMLAAKGFDSITDRERLYENNKDGKQHNALYDVEMEVGIYRRLILGGT